MAFRVISACSDTKCSLSIFKLSNPAFHCLLELLKNLCQEVLKAQCDVAVAIVVVLLEDVGHALERNAALNKEVETHNPFISLVVCVEDQLDKLGA